MKRLRRVAQHVVVAGVVDGAESRPFALGPPPEGKAAPARRLDAVFAKRVAEVHATALFDMEAPCVRNFSREQFDDAGFYAWEGLLTVEGNELVKQACIRVQQLQDEHWLDADWEDLSEEAWTSCGFKVPIKFLDADAKAAVRGGSQLGGAPAAERLVPPPVPAHERAVQNPPRLPMLDGYPPESFPAGYDADMMGVLTHPQMLRVNEMLLGARPLFDHHTMLSRKAGFKGQSWHSHFYHQDDQGASVVLPSTTKGQQLTLVRNLIYPDGFLAGDDGGLKLVPGGHLHRAARLPGASIRAPGGMIDDDALREGWMRGRTHPRTGEPLEILHCAAPPRTMMSVHTHIPHGVAPRTEGRGTRYCVTFNFASGDPDGLIARSPERRSYGLPSEWHAAATQGLIPGVSAEPHKNPFSLY